MWVLVQVEEIWEAGKREELREGGSGVALAVEVWMSRRRRMVLEGSRERRRLLGGWTEI